MTVTYASAQTPPRSEITHNEEYHGYFIQPARLIRGAGLPWDHQIQVALPPSYFDSGKTYPVLWVTDGSFRFKWAIDTLTLSGIDQEMIIVAIGAPPAASAEMLKRRTYDFLPKVDIAKNNPELQKQIELSGLASNETGGGSDFVSFVTGALRNDLGKRYLMSDDHVLYGSSQGGMFCVFALFENAGAFKSYICNSPPLAYGDGMQFRAEQQYARAHSDLAANLFLSAGEGEILQGGTITPFHVVSSMSLMAETLKLRNYPSLKLNVKIFPDEIHHRWTSTLSLRWALRELYHSPKSLNVKG
ncbi:hypothetical protein H8A95_24310 [Bradyrhizobium sp. Pear76]|uniref:alpha/beta hydrolase n=1 Tax=Bradyrhizobium oropedii TaxID=1571201 RepID=UPI001E31CD39|nr:alpha/beta hydrolase-fold protein [Bradyrhizobium oropedii]MCC8965353.1 hypothetical protein [Bradyrhizobium oropedii]